MYRKIILLAIVSLLMAATWIPTNAQNNQDVYFASEGDLWAWNPSMNRPERLTTWGYNGSPILSPDGSHIAYQSVASEAVEIAADPQSPESYLIYHGTPVNNIWVMNTATQEFERIADQSNDFPLHRGTPAWSPSGDEIAWVEYLSGENSTRPPSLMVYNFNTGQTRNLGTVNIGFQDAGLHLPSIQWGTVGITHLVFTFVETGDFQTQLHITDPISGNLSQFILTSSEPPIGIDVVPIDFVLVEHNARSMVAILDNVGDWTLLDPTNGSQFALAEAPTAIARNGSGGQLTPRFEVNNNAWQIRYTATAANGNTLDVPQLLYRLQNQVPALSPDGNALVSFDGDTLTYWQINGTDTASIRTPNTDVDNIFRPLNAVWTPMRWVTNVGAGDPVPTPDVPDGGTSACDAPMRLAIGDIVTVDAGPPNNLRTSAGLNGAFYASFYPGDVLFISDGPVCADGFRWWDVSGEGGFAGWTAEGSQNGDEWLIPVPNFNLGRVCPLPPRLTRGMTGIVLPGEPNAMRSGPDANGTQVIGSIPAGATFEVMGTSICGSDNRRWYPVSYNGRLGWTAEGENNTYWLAPSN